MTTIHHHTITIAREIRELHPVAAFVLFGLGWSVGLVGSFVVLAVAAALVTGLVLAARATAPTAILSATVTTNGTPATTGGMHELLDAAGLHVKEIKIAPKPQPRAGRGKAAVAAGA